MNNTKTPVATVVSFCFVTFLVGCAQPVKTVATATMPARVSEATKLKRLAILPLAHHRGDDITTEFEATIASVRVNDQPYFSVVERQRIRDLLKEMKLAESGVIDESTGAKLGKMAGANGVYTGAITRSEVNDERFTESRTRCDAHEQKVDKKGNVYQGKCLRFSNYDVSCTKRVANFAFAPKLIDVESATIKYSRDISATTSSSACSDHGRGVTPGSQLLHDARKNALATFRSDIAPHTRTMAVVLLESPEGISAQSSREKFTQALAFAQGNRMDRACELWNEAAVGEQQSAALHYNQGVCAEVGGDFNGALAKYTTADRLLTSPNKAIGDALVRVRQALDSREKLQEQMRTPSGTTSSKAADVQNPPALTSAAASAPLTMTLAEAQQRLTALGYDPGPADGALGPKTAAALRAFQKSRKLAVTGKLDPPTVTELTKK